MSSRYLAPGPDARFAEMFFIVPLIAYAELCVTYFGDDPSACYMSEQYRQPRGP